MNPPSPRPVASERELLEAARRGDDDAFGRLAGPYRGELHAHCYRMLGSAADADDALQETLLRAWQRLPDRSQQATLRSLGDGALRQVVQRYVTAWERNDVDAVVALLADDAKLTMPPLPTWYRGRDQVALYLSGGPLAGATRWRLIPARASGQLAFGLYARDDETQAFTPRAVDVLTLRGAQIQEITAFLTPDAFRSFDLPAILPES